MEFDVNDYSFYEDSDWDTSFDDSFELQGTTTQDPSYWDKVWSAVNSPVGSGIIVGAAQGGLSYLSERSNQKAATKLSKAATEEQRRVRDAHNASISLPFTGAKKVRYNGKS
jgi:hypothetical protein